MGNENENVEVIRIPEQFSYSFADIFNIEDEQNRVILLNCEIDDNVVDDAVYHILRYNRVDKGIPPEERRPILIYINSPGGDYIDGYSLADVICASKTPVYTINIGLAGSMAFTIFISGHKRYAMQNSCFLLHDGNIDLYDSSGKVFDRAEFLDRCRTEDKKFITDHTAISKELYDEKYRVEWWMFASEAKGYGVVDYIIGTDCDIDEIL